ncbi:hypothetical protein AALA24_13510 [Anaerovoracaceae bacterium 42-11]
MEKYRIETHMECENKNLGWIESIGEDLSTLKKEAWNLIKELCEKEKVKRLHVLMKITKGEQYVDSDEGYFMLLDDGQLHLEM